MVNITVGKVWMRWNLACSLCLVALSLLLFAQFVCCGENAIGKKCDGGEVLDGVDMGVHQHKNVDVGKIICVESEDLGHGLLDYWAETVMFYGVLCCATALKKAGVEGAVTLLAAAGSVPFIPERVEDSSPDSRCSGVLKLVEQVSHTPRLPVWGEVTDGGVRRNVVVGA